MELVPSYRGNRKIVILQRKEYDNEENIQYYYWSATNNGVGLHICNQSYTNFASA